VTEEESVLVDRFVNIVGGELLIGAGVVGFFNPPTNSSIELIPN
jgi:hypothetical protein